MFDSVTVNSRVLWYFAIAVAIATVVYYYNKIKHVSKLDHKKLSNKNIIVTGCSRGIGEQIAYECAKGNANVIMVARNMQGLQKVAKQCRKFGCASVHCIALDLSTLANCKLFVQKCLTIFEDGKIDYLILNHVIGHYSQWIHPSNSHISMDHDQQQSSSSFDMNQNLQMVYDIMSTNTSAYISISTLLYPYLQANHGRIVVLESMAGVGILPFVSVYGASKHALLAFFEGWNAELSRTNNKNKDSNTVSITICILGLIATQLAIEKVTGFLPQSVVDNAANPNTTAKEIITGGQQRVPYVWAPYWTVRMSCLIHRISPSLFTAINFYVTRKR